jgi:hypothetical protein
MVVPPPCRSGIKLNKRATATRYRALVATNRVSGPYRGLLARPFIFGGVHVTWLSARVDLSLRERWRRQPCRLDRRLVCRPSCRPVPSPNRVAVTALTGETRPSRGR